MVRLLGEGVPIDIVDGYGSTALGTGASKNQTDVIRELLQRGAEVNKQDRIGSTALHWSARNNSTDAIQLL